MTNIYANNGDKGYKKLFRGFTNYYPEDDYSFLALSTLDLWHVLAQRSSKGLSFPGVTTSRISRPRNLRNQYFSLKKVIE